MTCRCSTQSMTNQLRWSLALALALALSLSAVLHRARGQCFDTGCLTDWSCEQYDGMTETRRKPCNGTGHVYSCCYRENTEDPGRSLCRVAECTPDSDGCSTVGGTEVGRMPCDGGNAFFCCDEPAGLGQRKTGDMTYYELGLTACGETYNDNDMVAALAFHYFTAPNPNLDPICGRRVRIVDPVSSKSVVVQIRDKCAGCKFDDIDVSPAAFVRLRPKSVGRVKVVWDFV